MRRKVSYNASRVSNSTEFVVFHYGKRGSEPSRGTYGPVPLKSKVATAREGQPSFYPSLRRASLLPPSPHHPPLPPSSLPLYSALFHRASDIDWPRLPCYGSVIFKIIPPEIADEKLIGRARVADSMTGFGKDLYRCQRALENNLIVLVVRFISESSGLRTRND